MKEGWNRLKDAFNKEPVTVVLVTGIFLGGVAKLIDAVTGARSKNAYAKQINRKH